MHNAFFMFIYSFADSIKLEYNNDIIPLSNPPIIVEGNTLVPMRDIFELMELDIFWDSETRSATGTFKNFNIVFPIDENKYIIGSTEITTDVSAQIIDGTTYIPLRVIVEAIGANVIWKPELNKIDIDTGQIDKTIEI